MTPSRPLTVRPTLLVALVVTVLLALLAIASAATAKTPPRFHRGHLPAIGEIKLTETKGGRAIVTVPVSYTKAISPDTPGLEFAEVTLTVARKVEHRHAVGTWLRRSRRHLVLGTGTVVEHFGLPRRVAHQLLALPRKVRGRLVRIEVRHRIRDARGKKPMHEKDSSVTMASSHQARPQGEAAAITVRNATAVPLQLSSEPILCMYTNGEAESNLQAFTLPEGEMLPPGGTIEAKVEGSANGLEAAEYQGGTGKSAGRWFDWEGVAVDALANAFEIEITPIMLAWDFAEHCDAQASTFLLATANASGEAMSTQSWVVTAATCKIGCVHTNLPTAGEALGVQGVGEEETNPGVWAHDSTEVLKTLVGDGLLQNKGLEWQRAAQGEIEEEEWWYVPGEYGPEPIRVPVMRKAFELSIHEAG